MKEYCLFYFCDGIGSVFDSQVLALLNAISSRQIFKKVYLFIGLREENQIINIYKKKAIGDIQIIFFKSYPNYPFFNLKTRKSVNAALLDLNCAMNNVIFHTRGEMLAWHLTQILESQHHKRIIPDIRGVSIEEIEEYQKLNRIIKSIKIINYRTALRSLNNFNYISVVSYSLKEYLVNNFQIDPDKIVVTPCLADRTFIYSENQRKFFRKEFNLPENEFLVVFSGGGNANWHKYDELIMLADKELKVLNLSNTGISHKNIFNKFVDYTEVPMYLNAADIAVIWRDKSTVNKVASPVKFSEYICCGLPVISNYTVDMVSDYITKHDCGLLTDSIGSINLDGIRALINKNRTIISKEGISHFGVDIITDQYSKIYNLVGNYL